MRSLVFPVAESSRVSEVRAAAVQLAQEEGLSGALAGSVGIVATESATNLVKHAQGGEIYLSPLSDRGAPGVEILSIDNGPGMESPERCLSDGFSSSGTAGTGLGAIRRASQVFDLYSQPGLGTVVLSQITAGGQDAVLGKSGVRIGVVKRPLQGEDYCGDDWAVSWDDQVVLAMLADGLGHGVDASEAATAAVEVFLRANAAQPYMPQPGEILARVHNGLKGTRGAAVAVARVDYQEGKVIFAGLGNICGSIVSLGASNSMVSLYGTTGHSARRIQEYTYSLIEDGLVVLHSDGLSAAWTIDGRSGLFQCHPSVIAGVLFRKAQRVRDDACIIVIKKGHE